jgi:hypothetical protein
MEKFEVSERPIPVRLIDKFQYVTNAVFAGIVVLNLCSSTISTTSRHTGPQGFEKCRLYWSYARHYGVEMPTARRHSASTEPPFVATNEANLATKMALQTVNKTIENLLCLSV